MTSCPNFGEKLIIFIVMDNGNGLPVHIKISRNKNGKLLSELGWPKESQNSRTIEANFNSRTVPEVSGRLEPMLYSPRY